MATRSHRSRRSSRRRRRRPLRAVLASAAELLRYRYSRGGCVRSAVEEGAAVRGTGHRGGSERTAGALAAEVRRRGRPWTRAVLSYGRVHRVGPNFGPASRL
jgi:hypothetical protein